MVHPLHHSSDSIFIAVEMGLHRTIRAIANPATDPEFARLTLAPGAKEDALDSAGDPNGARDPRHQTVAMSGASSAFMPTTL